MSQIIKNIEAKHLKKKVPNVSVGDLVKVKVLIREGKKERNQAFEGMVIAVQGGSVNRSFTVRKIFQGVAIERTFMLHSPKVTEVKIVRTGKTRRAKLYYMRERIGTKSIRLAEDKARMARETELRAKEAAEAKAEAEAAAKAEAEKKAKEEAEAKAKEEAAKAEEAKAAEEPKAEEKKDEETK